MSVLATIRNRSGLLVGIVALALLVFILESAFESGNSFFSGDKNQIGKISGKKVSIEEFERRFQQNVDNEKQRTGTNTIDEGTSDRLRQQVWSQLMYEYIMDKEYAAAGIAVSTDELSDMVQGKNPHPQVLKAFSDPKTGQFNPANVIQFLKTMDQDQTGDTKNRWLIFEQAIKAERVSQKYMNMIKGGMYTTTNEARLDYVSKNKLAKAKFIAKRYMSVSDSAITVTTEEVEKYYTENKYKYKQPETVRSIEFVTFDVMPSNADREEAMQSVIKLIDDFKKSDNDTNFVNMNSDTKFDPNYYAMGALPQSLDTLFNAEKGTVIGPYVNGAFFKLSRLTAVKMESDTVKARHILLKGDPATKNKAALATADSLKKLIKAGKKFEDLAKLLSEDAGSKEKGGDLGWFKSGMMVKEFNDACFNGKKGDMPIVETQFGVHLIEVLDKGPESKRIMVASVTRELLPSTATFQQVYATASQFAGKNTSADLFNKGIIEGGLNKRIADNIHDYDRNLNGLDNARELVRWVYSAEVNDVSKVFEMNNKYVIAVLRDVREKGFIPMESIRPQLEVEAKKAKKAEKFVAELSAGTTGVANIEQASSKVGATVERIDQQSFFSSSVASVGREPALVGTIFTLKPNAVSKPIIGENGVYVISIESFTEAPALTDIKGVQVQLINANKSRVDYELFEALKEKTEVVDNRSKFY